MIINFAPEPTSVIEGKLFEPPEDEIWVTSHDDVHKLAASVVLYVQDFNPVYLASIGAAALNQAVKAVAIARGMLAPSVDLLVQPFFSTITDNKDRTRSRIVLGVTPFRNT